MVARAFAGSDSLPLLTISFAASVIDFSKPSLLYCQTGYHAATAASLLKRESIANVGVLMGSDRAWQAGQPESLETGQLEYAG